MNLKTILAVSALGCLGLSHKNIVSADEPGESIPTSHASPEGAAADLVHAFVTRDFHAFNEARPKSFCEGPTDPFNYYVMFRNSTKLFKMGESFNETNLPSRLMKISRVYSAQPLTTAKQREIASAFVHGWHEPTLVDVVVEDRQGNEFLHRTIVVKPKDSDKWYAQPQLVAHDYLTELLLQLPKSESVSWQITEVSDDDQ